MDDRETRRLYRSDTDKMICGVCGGIGEYFNVDATLIRLLWAVLAIPARASWPISSRRSLFPADRNYADTITILAPAAFAARSFFSFHRNVRPMI